MHDGRADTDQEQPPVDQAYIGPADDHFYDLSPEQKPEGPVNDGVFDVAGHLPFKAINGGGVESLPGFK